MQSVLQSLLLLMILSAQSVCCCCSVLSTECAAEFAAENLKCTVSVLLLFSSVAPEFSTDENLSAKCAAAAQF